MSQFLVSIGCEGTKFLSNDRRGFYPATVVVRFPYLQIA